MSIKVNFVGNKMVFGALASLIVLSASVRAGQLNGRLGFSGSINMNTGSAGTATAVTGWHFVGNSGSPYASVAEGDFAPALGLSATIVAPWNLNSGPVPGFFSVGGFAFDLTVSAISFQKPPSASPGGDGSLAVDGIGWVSGNGFDPTPMTWHFTTQDPGAATNPKTFSFSASALAEPCTGQMGDYVWVDLNGNGLQDDGNTGINGVKVELYQGATLIKSTTTADNAGVAGYYQFTGLCDGTYTVKVVGSTVPAGLVSTTVPGSSTGNDGVGNDSNNPGGTTVTLSSGNNDIQTIDFGYYQPACIGDYVWEDQNANGIQDEVNTGIAGVRVELHKCSDESLVTSMNTGPDGKYQFCDLKPGDYYLVFGKPADYVYTGQNKGTDDCADSDADSSGKTVCTTLTSGEVDDCWDTGLYKPSALGNYVWVDANGNGIQDEPASAGVNGVTVKLFKCGDDVNTATPVATTTTADGTGSDPLGYYQFTGLVPGCYKVQFIKPCEFMFTVLNAPLPGTSATDSDADPTTGVTADVTLAPGESNQNVDAGLVCVKPVFAGLPGPMGPYQCLGDLPNPPTVTATDNCGIAAAVTFHETQSNPGSSCNNTIMRTWTATSPCGAVATFRQTIEVNDTTPPVLANLPVGGDLGCNPARPICSTAVTASDLCDGNVTPTVSCTPSGIMDDGACGKSQTFVYTAQDACGNQASVSVVYTWKEDSIAPELTCPPDVEVGCDGTTDPSATGTALAKDNCSASPAITYSDVSSQDSSGNTVIKRTWTATDGCGNQVSCTQTITVTGGSTECKPGTFVFSNGNSTTYGSFGNIRTFTTTNGVSVKVSAWSRSKSTGIWSPAYLGQYGGGLGVTDQTEGYGANNSHTVDNIGEDNFVLFEFSEPVVVSEACVGYVVSDSDLTAWIGTFGDPYNNHLILDDTVLGNFAASETSMAGSSSLRCASLNASQLTGNALVIAAWPGDATPDDQFKIATVTACKRVCTPPRPCVTSICGNVLNDSNSDGCLTGDQGLKDITVVLKTTAGAIVATTKTASDGSYCFDSLTGGTYVVSIVVPDKCRLTTGCVTDTWKDRYGRRCWSDNKGNQHWYDYDGTHHWKCSDGMDRWIDKNGNQYCRDYYGRIVLTDRGCDKVDKDDSQGKTCWKDRSGQTHWTDDQGRDCWKDSQGKIHRKDRYGNECWNDLDGSKHWLGCSGKRSFKDYKKNRYSYNNYGRCVLDDDSDEDECARSTGRDCDRLIVIAECDSETDVNFGINCYSSGWSGWSGWKR